MPYPRIDPGQIHVLPLSQRRSFIDITKSAIDPDSPPPSPGDSDEQVRSLAAAFRTARQRGASRILTYGAHLIKNGCGLLLRRLIETGWVTHLATQGAGIIHDWEFAHLGHSSESVRDNAPVGRFGTWDDTGRAIVGCLLDDQPHDRGFGESLGKHIETHAEIHPFRQYSVTHCAYRHGVPLCVLPGIGYDIFACHPMFTLNAGAALGRASTADFHTFAHGVTQLTGGVYLSVGSAVMSPQVFEKAFSIANNLRNVAGEPYIRDHYVAIVDIQPSGGWDFSSEQEPPMDHPAYYLRWCKTFARMTAPHPQAGPGGTLAYIQADNRRVLHQLVAMLTRG